MVSTGAQAASAQGWGTVVAERQPPVAAVERSSGSPSSSTTTEVVAEVSRNWKSRSAQVPFGNSCVQQVSRSTRQGISIGTVWTASRGGRFRISRRVSWAGPAANGSAADVASTWAPTSRPGSGRPVNGALQVTQAVPCRSTTSAHAGSPPTESRSGSPSSSTQVDSAAWAA